MNNIFIRHRVVTMFSLGLIVISLVGCGGSSSSDGNGGGGTGELIVNIFNALANPVQGAVVTLDSATGASAMTDAAGTVVFSNIAGTHDVHVLAINYAPSSFYGVAAGTVNATLEALNGESFVNFQGTFTNSTIAPTMALVTATDNYQGAGVGIGNYTASISLLDVPTGSSVAGTLWALENTFDFGSFSFSLTDAVNLGANTFTTVADQVAAPQTFNVSFNVSKPAQSSIVTINGITPPVGTTPLEVRVGEVDSRGNVLALTSTLTPTPPLTLSASDPFNLSSVIVKVTGTTPQSGLWMIWESWVKGASDSINAAMTTLPLIASGQIGETIQFTPSADVGISAESLVIMDNATENLVWLIRMPAGQNTVTLPDLGILTTGTTYKIGVVSHLASGKSYTQMLTLPPASFPVPMENGFSPVVTYIR